MCENPYIAGPGVSSAEAFLGTFIWCLHVVTAFAFYQRRDKQPIKGRLPELVLAQVGSLCMFGFILSLNAISNYNFCIFPIVSQLYYVLPFCFTIIRFEVLSSAYELTRASAVSNRLQRTKRWFFRFKKYFRMRYYVLLTFIVVSAFNIPIFVELKQRNGIVATTSSLSCECLEMIKICAERMLFFVCIALVVLFASTVKMWKVQENLGIKMEVKQFFCVFLVQAILLVIDNARPGALGQYFRIFAEIFPGLLFWWIGEAQILLLSYSPKFQGTTGVNTSSSSTEKSTHNAVELLQVLENEVPRELLKRFMVHEFSVENLQFVLSVRNLRSNPPADFVETRAEIQNIFDDYVDINAPFCINISSAVRLEIRNTLFPINSPPRPSQDLSLDWKVYEQAEKEILELICKDTFRRFKLETEEYRQWRVSQIEMQDNVAVLKQLNLN